MTNTEVMELAEIIFSLPNWNDEYHTSKYLIIDRAAQWLEEKKKPDELIGRFGKKCWTGW